MKRLYILTILLSVFALTGNAQQDNHKWRIGLYSGGMGYFGDLNTRIINPQTQFLANPPQQFRPAFGLSIERNLNAQFGLKALWSNGRFTANDRAVSFSNVLQTDALNFNRSLNARTQINDFSLIGSLYLERSRTFKKIQFSPYLMLGIGLTDFEVFGDLFYDTGNRYHYWSDFTVRNSAENDFMGEAAIVLQDGNYETNLTKLQTEDQAYSTTVANIPFGLGFKFRLGKQLNLNLETLFHYTFTDYLDDVSGVYPSFEIPEPLQSYASNPTGQQGIWRGREDDRFNDIYTFNTISLQYSFGYRAGTTRPPVEFSNVGEGEKTIYERETIVVNDRGDTLRIEKQTREDNAEEAARIRELSDEKSTLEEEIAMLEKEIGEEKMPEEEVVVEVEKPERPSRKDRRRDRLEREAEEAARIEKLSEEKATIEEEIAMLEKEIGEAEASETPEVEIVIEEPAVEIVKTEMPEMETETSMTPEVEIVTEPDITVAEGERPARPAKPDISLGGETTPEVEIVVEPEISEGAETEMEMSETETEEVAVEEPRSRKDRRRNRRNKEVDVTIGEPDEPSVEIVVGNEEPEAPIEITIEQPEQPVMEIEVEEPTEPMVEVEIEEPTEPVVEVEIEKPIEPIVEVEVEEPTEPMVEVEIEEPTEPVVEVEVEKPTEPMVEIEIEKPTEPMVEVEVEKPTEPMVEVETEMPEEVAIEVEKPTMTRPKPKEDDRSSVLNPNIENPAGVNFASMQDAIDAYKDFSIYFEDEAYYVSMELYDELDALVQTMHRFPSSNVTLQGHTAETQGVSHFHQEVTRKRVYYIQNYLVTKGIELDRILLSFLDAPSNLTDLNKQQVHTILK